MVVIEYKSENKDIEVQLKCSATNSSSVVINDNDFLVMNESPIICPLLNITLKAAFIDDNTNDNKNSDGQKGDDQNTNNGYIGYIFLIVVLFVAFSAFYIVIRNPERREIVFNIIKFKSRNNVRYQRVSGA
jgi:hypothetical protein